MILKFCKGTFFAELFGREKLRFLKLHLKQMIPAEMQSHHSVFVFSTIYAAFHRFNFCQEDFTGIQVFIVLSFTSEYM